MTAADSLSDQVNILTREYYRAKEKVEPLEEAWVTADEAEMEAREELHQARLIVVRLENAIAALEGRT